MLELRSSQLWEIPGMNFGMFKSESLKLMCHIEIKSLEKYVNWWESDWPMGFFSFKNQRKTGRKTQIMNINCQYRYNR